MVIVSGGNTLFAADRWKLLGVDALLRACMERGCVLCGGSAGAMAWFQTGHSDSADPATYRTAKLDQASLDFSADNALTSSQPPAPEPWEYIKIPALGFVPGCLCPHYDSTQSNGIKRAIDFDKMMLQLCSNERGIGLDHWCALVVNGGAYEIVPIPGKPSNSTEDGVPGLWLLDVVDGAVQKRRVTQMSGALSELLRAPTGDLIADPRAEKCRKDNPCS